MGGLMEEEKEKTVTLWAVNSCGLGKGLIKRTFSLIEAVERRKDG